jgi:hypothetical protein
MLFFLLKQTTPPTNIRNPPFINIFCSFEMDGRSGGGGREDPWTSVGGLDVGDVRTAGYGRGGRASSIHSDADSKGYQSDALDDIDSDDLSEEEEEEEEILSEEMILEAAGVEDASQVKELEIVFEKLSPDLAVLRTLISVQQITCTHTL